MGVIDKICPENVFKYFEQISKYLVDFAKERNLRYIKDEKLNVIIYKDGSAGYEKSEPVILQGHMDMVAVKTSDCNKDMEKEGLELEINGDWISAKKTSLGGDDGIAVAYALAVLDAEDMAHPPIEAVFTVDEEIGLLGAHDIKSSELKGRTMINLDSEEEGIFTVSCAGGSTVECILPFNTEPINAQIIEIRIQDFTGGHSGMEIIKQGGNANCVMGRILLNVFQNVGMRIMAVNGGEKDNVIAKISEAAIAVLPETVDTAKSIIEKTFEEIKDEYSITDPNAKIIINVIEEGFHESLSGPATLAAIISLVNMPNGIQKMNPSVSGMVQTSLNLGVIRTELNEVKLTYCVRSSKESEKKYLIEKLRSLTEIFGGTINVKGEYPAWEYREHSHIREVAIAAYKEIYDKEPIVEGVHAGLECGIFAGEIKDLDAISLGPDIKNVHTTEEALCISSTERTWKLLVKILEMLK
jgi:dipeptidase D